MSLYTLREKANKHLSTMVLSIHIYLLKLLFVKARHHLLFFIILIVAAILLFFSSALFLPTELENAVFRSPQIDTIGHFIGFFVLAWLLHSVLKITLLSTLLTLSFYGALSELGQYYLGFRNGEFSDFFADIAGVAFFISLKMLFLAYRKVLFSKTSLSQSKATMPGEID